MKRVHSRSELLALVGSRSEFAEGLVGLDLTGLDLSNLDGRRRFFDRCDFARSDLSHADLSGSMFRKCTFAEANVSSAVLRDSSFSGCDFTGADLRFADLRGSDLMAQNTGDSSGMNDFRGASIEGARFADAVGIAECRWDEPPAHPGSDERPGTGPNGG